MITTTYLLRLTMEAPIEIPRDVIEKVLDYSTAVEAIEDGIRTWLPITDDDVDAAGDDELFALSLSVVEPA